MMNYIVLFNIQLFQSLYMSLQIALNAMPKARSSQWQDRHVLQLLLKMARSSHFFFFLVASLIKSSLFSLTERFDLRRTQFLCSSCGNNREATPENYIESGYFPGTTSSISCYFSIELIEFWNILKHETPGTSERKFVKTLEIISKMRGRVSKLRNFKRQIDHIG